MKNSDTSLSNLADFNDQISHDISQRLYTLRNDILHLNQSQCAAVLEISQTYLSLIESGKRKISKELISQYVEHFNVSSKWILYGDDSNGIICQDSYYNADFYAKQKKEESLVLLKNAFQLNKEESEYISRFLSMDPSKRRRFIKAVNDLKDL